VRYARLLDARCSRSHRWSPDGTHIITPNSTNNGVFVSSVVDRSDNWNADISLVGHPNVVEVTAFNPLVFLRDGDAPVEGKNLCTLLALAARSSVSLWVTARSRPLVVVHDIFDRDILDLAWSKDGTRLFASSSEGHVAVLIFKLSELPPLAPPGTAQAYHSTFGFEKPVRPVYQAPVQEHVPARQIRAPSPQKTTMVNGKRRIQPSFIAHLGSIESTSEPVFQPPPRPAPQLPATAAALLEARMNGSSRPTFGGFASISGTTSTGMPPPASPLAVSPRKRKASTALLLGPDEDAGPSRLPFAPPRGAKSRAPGQGLDWTSLADAQVRELEPALEWDRLGVDEVELEVPAIKSFGSVRMASTEDDVERIEWRNYAGGVGAWPSSASE
jgi:protein HIRA/HIR1